MAFQNLGMALREEQAVELINYQLRDSINKIFTLSWDGKIFKSFNHVGNDTARVAVILTDTDGEEVLLSIIAIEGQSTAENEAKHIIQVLKEYNICSSSIAALVFDTTAVNSGYRQGVVVRLEAEFGRPLLQLPCRHHILELVAGASCSVVYGTTTGPKELLFKKLIDNWGNLDLKKYSPLELPRHHRELAGLVKDIVTFLQDWLQNSSKEKLRHDYLELATLTLLFLGGTVPKSISSTIKSPGAFHHAR